MVLQGAKNHQLNLVQLRSDVAPEMSRQSSNSSGAALRKEHLLRPIFSLCNSRTISFIYDYLALSLTPSLAASYIFPGFLSGIIARHVYLFGATLLQPTKSNLSLKIQRNID